jgi:cytochrome c oxidase subunit 2
MPSALDPHGPAAALLARNGVLVLSLFVGVTAVMWLLLLWVALRKRGSLAHHAPIGAGGGMPWVLIGGFGIPAAVLAGVFIGMLVELRAVPLDAGHAHGTPSIRIVGHRWWWEIVYRTGGTSAYVTTANELHIPTGTDVDIELGSTDVIHSFWVPSLHGKVDLIPNQSTHIRIQASDAGMYRGQCAEFCGAQHANMLFWVVAEPPAQFAAWLEAQRAPGRVPVGDIEQQGQQVFITHACVTCHSIRGTLARATVGPDLTHVGSRRSLAGPFPNDESWLRAWVSHAQSLKPGVLMPSLPQFDEGELQALTTYLRSLR